MAINWDIKLSNVNLQSKRADITFTREDTESALTPQTYSYRNVLIETAEQRVSLLNSVKAKVEADATKQTTVDALITDLEQAGKSNLEAWEATR